MKNFVRIIHCADLHLDSKMTAHLSSEKARERKAELLNTFSRMVEYAANNEVDGIIIAGDLFDTKAVLVGTRNTVRRQIEDTPEIQFFYLKGNHDADSFLSSLDKVPDNLHMFEDVWKSYRLEENVVITGVELNKDNSNLIYDSLVLNNDDFNIVVLHGQETDTLSKDKTEAVSLRQLKNKGIDYLALGHVHEYKKGALDSRGKYCYCGCLEGRGFDECGEHGFVQLDIYSDNGKYEVKDTFIPFACRRLYTVEADISGCLDTSDIMSVIDRQLDEAGCDKRSLVKIVLNGAVDISCEKNVGYLIKRLEDRFYFVKIADDTVFKVDYESFTYDESLKGEFVRIVEAAKDLEQEDKADIIRLGINMLTGGEI